MTRANIIAMALLLCPGGALPQAQPGPGLERRLVLDLSAGVKLRFEVSPFVQGQHKLSWCTTTNNPKHLCAIDGRPYFGSDGQVPYTQLDAAVLEYGTHAVRLDVSCMFNPWVGSANRSLYSVEPADDGYLVRGAFSDGAGAYVADWLVVGDGSVRTELRFVDDTQPCDG